jgi:restriction system protein
MLTNSIKRLPNQKVPIMPRGNAKGPEFVQYFGPVLKALNDLGGLAAAGDVVDAVAALKNVSEAEQERRNQGGALRFYNQVAWARQYLMWAGLLDGSKRGLWRLTDKGLAGIDMSQAEAVELFKQQHALHAEKADTQPGSAEEIEEEPQSPPEGYQEKLLSVIKGLTPQAFERLCKRLLAEYGLEKVHVTGKKGDGGVDGTAILKVNTFVTFKVIFQCKRYAGSVDPSTVREFRGAMHHRADKGIMLTTGTFTKKAQEEALNGIPQIELVNGEELVELFEEKGLGLIPTYEVDLSFFEQFKAEN